MRIGFMPGEANALHRSGQREPALASALDRRRVQCVPARRRFRRYLGIDYSGAATAETPLPGIRVQSAEAPGAPPQEIQGPGLGGRWSRRELALWLAHVLQDAQPTIIGLDHGLSCPLPYFKRHGIPLDWDAFLDDFARHWPTDRAEVTVRSLRPGNARAGEPRWRRPCEQRTGAKSVFHFDVPGSVANSTHAGLPWLRRLRATLGPALHCWPFDGWQPAADRHVLAEIYPSRWSDQWPREDRMPDQHDAYAVAAALAAADGSGELEAWLQPALPPAERAAARVEGWILGVS